MADLQTVVLALSPRAAETLENFITFNRDDATAKVAHPEIIDAIRDEIGSQLTGRALSTPVTPAVVQTAAERVASQMAKAAAEAVAG